MGIIIKGDVKGDIISDGGVKNETHYHYGDEHKIERQAQTSETHISSTAQNTANVVQNTQVSSRQCIIDALMDLIDKGNWANGVSAEDVKGAMQNLLDDEHSDTMWRLFLNGRSDRLRVPWQNMIGYFVERKLLPTSIGAPALNEMFFGDKEGYTNIDKGKPRDADRMSNGFREVIPLLDKHFSPLLKTIRKTKMP